jgi:FkbM family methyltransferase
MKAIFFEHIYDDYIAEIMVEIFKDRLYDRFFKGKKGLNVVDMGANIGLFSLYAQPFAQKIVAFEPSETHFEKLSEMVKFNKFENIIPLKMAVSDVPGKRKFYHLANRTAFSLVPVMNNQSFEEVEVTTVGKVFEYMDHVDFLKLDVEAEEMKVLLSDDFRKYNQKIDKIVVEWHYWANTNPDQLRTLLMDYGYRVEKLPADALVFSAVR